MLIKEIYKGDTSTDLQSFHGKDDRVMDDIIESWRDLVLPHLLCTDCDTWKQSYQSLLAMPINGLKHTNFFNIKLTNDAMNDRVS